MVKKKINTRSNERPKYINTDIEPAKTTPTCFVRHEVNTAKAASNMSLDEDYQQPKILKFSRAARRDETKSPATRQGSVCSEKTESIGQDKKVVLTGRRGKPMCFEGFVQPRMTSLSVGPNPDVKREETPPIIVTTVAAPAPTRDIQEMTLN